MPVFVIIIIIAVIFIALLYSKKMEKDKDYTIVKGMFKSSDYYLSEEGKDKKSGDASDYDYWNKDQLK